MLDRESTFRDEKILKMLSSDFVPVAIDQWFQRRQKDSEGLFYQKIASQGPRSDFNRTTQGFYIATPEGELIAYNNNRGPDRIRGLMEEAVKSDVSRLAKPLPGPESSKERREIPLGALVVQVNAKVLSGYSTPENDFEKIFQSAISRDNLWINQAEQKELLAGAFPESLRLKIARFHLLDNTRGEPMMWSVDEITSCAINLDNNEITGSATIQTADKSRGIDCEIRGRITKDGDSINGFDLVAKGKFWGEGPYTRNAPQGRFPIAIAFRLADSKDLAFQVLPQGIKAIGQEYK